MAAAHAVVSPNIAIRPPRGCRVAARARVLCDLPHQVNRHIVELRPVGMNIPFSCMASESRFSDFLDELFERGHPTVLPPHTSLHGRYYEESTTVFWRCPSAP